MTAFLHIFTFLFLQKISFFKKAHFGIGISSESGLAHPFPPPSGGGHGVACAAPAPASAHLHLPAARRRRRRHPHPHPADVWTQLPQCGRRGCPPGGGRRGPGNLRRQAAVAAATTAVWRDAAAGRSGQAAVFRRGFAGVWSRRPWSAKVPVVSLLRGRGMPNVGSHQQQTLRKSSLQWSVLFLEGNVCS